MKGDDRVEEKLIRDKLGSPVEGQIQTENGDFAVMSLEGEIVTDVDFSQTKMLRDKLGSPIPQRWSTEVNGYVAVTTENMGTGGGGDGGPVTWSGIIGKPSEFPPIPHTHTIDDIDGLLDELNNITVNVDGETIVIKDGQLTAESLVGLVATIQEINNLQGTKGNLQGQIDALSNIGNFSTSVDTYADLQALTGMQSSDMVIVLSDETRGNSSTIYIYNGSVWSFAGEFKGGEIRDFTTNPIDLQTETTNILPKSRYEKQNASETAFTDSSGKITATNVQDAIKQVYQRAEQNTGGGSGYVSWSNITGKPTTFPSTIAQVQGLQDELNQVFTQVSSGKLSLETAIETKGVKVNKSSDIATFDELRMAILAIVTGTGESTGNDLRMAIDDVISIDFQQPTATNPTEYINYPITNVADSVTVTLQEV